MKVLMRAKSLFGRFFPIGSFARGVSVLVGGTTAAQALLVLASPVLTRLYSPDDFGGVALFLALLTMISVVAALRYELAIPLPEEDHVAANLLAISVFIVCGVTLITTTIVLISSNEIATALGVASLAENLWLLPVGVFFVGLFQIVQKWSIRTKSFGVIAKAQVLQSLVAVIIQLAASGFGLSSLITGQVLGRAVGCGRLTLNALRHPALRSVSLSGMRDAGSHYKQFPIYSTWNALLNTASLQLAPVAFAVFFGASVAGFYALTLRILTLPANVIGNAVAGVFLAHASEAQRSGDLSSLVNRLHGQLSRVGTPALLFTIIAGPDAFALVFGAEWQKAGEYARWMAPWIYLQFKWSPISTLASVLGLQKEALMAQIFTIVVRVTAILLCVLFSTTADTMILCFAITSGIVYLMIQLWFLKRVNIGYLTVLKNEVKNLLLFGIIVLPAIIAFFQPGLEFKAISAMLFLFATTWWYIRFKS